MNCRHCGTEIAEKALICYRCGKATADPRITPPAETSLFARRRRVSGAVIAAALAGAAALAVALYAWLT